MSADDPEAELLAAVERAPQDVQARAVYADWLEERGDPRGEFLRLEMQLSTLPERLAALVARIDPAWIKMVTGAYRLSLVDSTVTNKIGLIKMVREATGLGLKEAKDVVDAVSTGQPRVIAEAVDLDRARELVLLFQPLTSLRVEPQIVPPIVPRPRERADISFYRSLGEYRRPYRVLLVSIDADRRLDAIRFLRERTSKGLSEVRDLVAAIQNGTPFELANRIDASTAAELAVDAGVVGATRTERVSEPTGTS